MSTVNREELLNILNLVKGGLSAREFIEQSSCFVFQNGEVMTFNDEVACRMACPLDITGAVQSGPLLDVLAKVDDEELEVRENQESELEFRCKRKKFGLTKEAEVFLPIDRVELPEKWLTLPKAFIESVALVNHCVSRDQSRFLLTCIHIHPEYVEACDNMQAIRCFLETKLKEPLLVRGTSLEPLVNLGMDKFAMTESWLHFKNQQGLVYSCRRYIEDYPDLSPMFKGKGAKITIPKGLKTATERAKIFAVDKILSATVLVTLRDDLIQVSGQGTSGWYKERKKIRYAGEPLEFLIAPELLEAISDKYEEAILLQGKLKVRSESWVYITVLGDPKAVAEEADEVDAETQAPE